jgi:hypothetical protein
MDTVYVLVTLPDGTSEERWFTVDHWQDLMDLIGEPDNIIRPE